MNKIKDLIKPYLCIIFGALFLLLYSDFLDANGAFFAIGIVAAVLAVCYILIGVINVVCFDKVKDSNKNILKLCEYTMYPLFVFVSGLISLIEAGSMMQTRAIIIDIVGMAAAVILIIFHFVDKLGKKDVSPRYAYLINLVFMIAICTSLVFNYSNMEILKFTIGFVLDVLFVVLFAMILFDRGVAKEEKAKPAAEEKKPVEKKASTKSNKTAENKSEEKEVE